MTSSYRNLLFQQKGASLLELTLTIFILVLLLTLTQVDYSTTYHRAKIQTQQIFHTLQFARLEAIKRNQVIAVCGTSDFEHCTTDWSKGYMVFIFNRSQHLQNQILRKERPFFKGSLHSKKRLFFAFRGDGYSLSRGSIYVGSPYQYRILIADSGRARIESQHHGEKKHALPTRL